VAYARFSNEQATTELINKPREPPIHRLWLFLPAAEVWRVAVC
jgi:hypothetical protein